MAVDVVRIRCRVVGTRVPGAGSRPLQVNPARGGLGEAQAAAPSSRGRLRSARARISFTHLVELVPYSCASARRGGVDGGGVRRRPARIPRNADEAVRKSCNTDPGAPFGTSRRMPGPEDLHDLWRRRRGVRIRQPARVPDQSAGVAGRVRRQVITVPRLHGAVVRPSQRRGDCAHQRRIRRMDRDDDGRACAGKVDDRHWRTTPP